MSKLSKTKVGQAALEAGFMISTAYGQESNQPMPVSDMATLMRFYSIIEKMQKAKAVVEEI